MSLPPTAGPPQPLGDPGLPDDLPELEEDDAELCPDPYAGPPDGEDAWLAGRSLAELDALADQWEAEHGPPVRDVLGAGFGRLPLSRLPIWWRNSPDALEIAAHPSLTLHVVELSTIRRVLSPSVTILRLAGPAGYDIGCHLGGSGQVTFTTGTARLRAMHDTLTALRDSARPLTDTRAFATMTRIAQTGNKP